ncbi:MAG: hypothetical protein F4Z28_08775 [Gammaproteobacteria bacterium]|nr:hypothetical protein [Gammaproteobacteria bacterium]
MSDLGTFEDIAVINPQTPSASQGENVSFVAMAGLSEQGRLDEVTVRNAVPGYTPFVEGDVLVAKITPCLENGKGAHARHLPIPLAQGSTEFHVLRARSGTSDRYLYHLTRTDRFRRRAEALMTGSAGQRRVPAEFFCRYEIRVPPLEEQQRIAEILDTMDEAIQATEGVIAKHKLIRTGIVAVLLAGNPVGLLPSANREPTDTPPSAVSDGTKQPPAISEWPQHELGQIGVVVGGGTPSRERTEYWGGPIPWLTPSELTKEHSKFVYETQDRMSELGLAASGARLLPVGSLLITSRASIGFCALAGVSMATNQGFKSLLPSDVVDPSYLYYVGQTLGREMTRRASGTTFLEISGSEFKRIEIPLPPLDEQRRIAGVLDTVDEVIRAHRRQLAKLRKLRGGLAADLLSGRVRTVVA